MTLRLYRLLLVLSVAHGFALSSPRLSGTTITALFAEIGVGIDLGTTYSAVAVLDDGVPKIVEIPNHGRTMPSVVTVDDAVYRNVKRAIGTGGKLAKDIREVVPLLVPNTSGKTYKKDSLENRLYDAEHHPTMLEGDVPPESVSAQILQTLKATAEAHSGDTVTRAVIGIPAYFDDAQRAATEKAAALAGIPKVKLLREPEAAALAYGVGKEQVGLGDDDELVLVFDLGGGTFDVSMLLVGGGLTEIISTSGNAQLGGADFDNRIAQHMLKVLRENGVSTKNWSGDAVNAVIQSAEAIRIYLSNNKKCDAILPTDEQAWIAMESPSAVVKGSLDGIDFELTRKAMETLCLEELLALVRPVREVAIMAGALLPGDSSPAVVDAALQLEEELEASFGDFYDENQKEEVEEDTLLQLAEMDMKAAKKAQQRGRKRARNVAKEERKFRKKKQELNQSKPDERVKVRDGISGRPISRVVLVGGATRMPAVGRLLAALTGTTPQKTVNPDEAVALGCAVHVGVLDGVEGMGKVLNPMQAAILRAFAEQQGMLDDFDDYDEFGDTEYF